MKYARISGKGNVAKYVAVVAVKTDLHQKGILCQYETTIFDQLSY
jgi:hypothetical protein